MVHLAAGDTWDEPLVLRPSGSCDQPAACPRVTNQTSTVAVVAAPGASTKRPTIQLNGTGAAVTVSGFDGFLIDGIEMAHAEFGVVATGGTLPGHVPGNLLISDCVFRGLWNRSSIGQRVTATGRHCLNGCSQIPHPFTTPFLATFVSIMAGGRLPSRSQISTARSSSAPCLTAWTSQ